MTKKQENVTIFRKQIQNNPEMIERMGFVNKNVKAAIINMFKYLEENILGEEGNRR